VSVPRAAEAVVIGGGCVGASIAYHLARRGLRDVVLLEKRFLASGATGQSSGIVRQHYVYPVTARMAKLCLEIFSRFDEAIGGDAGFTRTGYLALVGPDDRDALVANVAMQQAVGVRTVVLGPAELRELVPQLNVDDIAAAAYEAEAGFADPASTTAALARRARDLGARILEGVEVRQIRTQAGAVTGVDTSDGPLAAPVVVSATGGWSPRLMAPLGVEVPILNTLHPMAAFERPAQFATPHPVCGDFVNEVYFRPEHGGLTLVGSSKHTKDDMVDPDEYPDRADPRWIQEFAARAVARFPPMETAQLRRDWCGFYDTTPDMQFILDRIPGVAGLFLAAGFSGHGFKHCPLIGDLVADLVLETAPADPHLDLSFFSLARFAAGRAHQARHRYAKVLVGR
jgi:glycine/D-amino acid oxidase-like deaminating enzyme